MSDRVLDELTERLDRLERANKSLRITIGLVFLGMAATALMGQATRSSQVLDVEAVVIRDKGRLARATLGIEADGAISLRLADKQGISRAVLGVPPNGSAGLALIDGSGKPRVTLSLAADSAPDLRFYDQKSTSPHRTRPHRRRISGFGLSRPNRRSSNRAERSIGWPARCPPTRSDRQDDLESALTRVN